ncbi:MAG: hypothetical protein SF066_04425 [Thermoanaerobaculia bacterium]|nr:hypothetical protein [Thermoanaerobaculia bacterium]
MNKHGLQCGLGCLLLVMGLEAQAQEAAVTRVAVERRAAELARLDRRDVLTQVRARARELAVVAPAGELTDLLGHAAELEIARDTCRLTAAANCHAVEGELAKVEAAFLALAGLSRAEFRAGRRAAAAPQALEFLAPASGESCTCSFTVYSSNRSMTGHWGLECNNHGGHGVCSNNVDSLHTAGIGAMTGKIDLFYGGGSASRDCPDDHFTCFRGPANGEWGNVCNCDSGHSQFWNPTGAWYGGDLSDAVEVWQLSTNWLSAAGACNNTYVVVQEFVKENDPWCCDDPMGTLSVALPLQDGVGSVSAPTTTTNCNGGSQSGVYPNCGTFGATIRVAYNCATYTPPPPDPWSCRDSCFSTRPDHQCSCDLGCTLVGDCCWDYRELCCDSNPYWNGCN